MPVQIKPAFMTYLWIRSFFTVDRGSWPWVSTFRKFYPSNRSKSCSWGRPHLLSSSKDPPSPRMLWVATWTFSPWWAGPLVMHLPLKSPYMILVLASDHWVDMSLRVGFSSLIWASNSSILLTENLSVTVKLFLSRDECPIYARHPTHRVHHRVHLSQTWKKEQEEVYCLPLSVLWLIES